MDYRNNGLQNAMNQAQSSAYANAAIPKQPTAAESFSKEIASQICSIERHTERLEGFADRLCGAQPQETGGGLGGPPRGNSHHDALTEFAASLSRIDQRVAHALNRLESFI